MGLAKFVDNLDRKLCRAGVLRAASWDMVRNGACRKLYAGGLSRELPQFRTHLGISPFDVSTRIIAHDMRDRMPIADDSIEVFQSEDVFEHISYDDMPPIIEDIFRVLRPGGLLRLSVPDYRCPILRDRSVKNESGKLVFDPGGGGEFVDGRVVGGGHVWFPTYESVKELLDGSSFARTGSAILYLHYTAPDGLSIMRKIDYSLGHVQRTPDHDERAMSQNVAMSIVVDAIKANRP